MVDAAVDVPGGLLARVGRAVRAARSRRPSGCSSSCRSRCSSSSGCSTLTFGSVKDSLLVFTGVPLALTGGVAALWLRGIPLSISAGRRVYRALGRGRAQRLVMITFINQLRERGVALDEAIFDGAHRSGSGPC